MDSAYEAGRVVARGGCKKMKKDLSLFCHCLILKHRSRCHSLLFGFFSKYISEVVYEKLIAYSLK